MTEQIITKNFYSLISIGGGGSANSDSAYCYLMKTDLNRMSAASDSQMIYMFHQPNLQNIATYHRIFPVKYSKLLSEMIEAEIYKAPYEQIFTSDNTHSGYSIIDSSTNLCTGIKLTTTHINNGTQDEIINGILYQMQASSSSSAAKCNLILTKFDTPITIAPTESYQFTLDLNNLFQTFPATIGS